MRLQMFMCKKRASVHVDLKCVGIYFTHLGGEYVN
jgi:hypothetical protein